MTDWKHIAGKCTCTDRPGDEYYCPAHGGGGGSWIDLKVKTDMLMGKLGDWIVCQNPDIKQTAAESFGQEMKILGQTLYKLPDQ